MQNVGGKKKPLGNPFIKGLPLPGKKWDEDKEEFIAVQDGWKYLQNEKKSIKEGIKKEQEEKNRKTEQKDGTQTSQNKNEVYGPPNPKSEKVGNHAQQNEALTVTKVEQPEKNEKPSIVLIKEDDQQLDEILDSISKNDFEFIGENPIGIDPNLSFEEAMEKSRMATEEKNRKKAEEKAAKEAEKAAKEAEEAAATEARVNPDVEIVSDKSLEQQGYDYLYNEKALTEILDYVDPNIVQQGGESQSYIDALNQIVGSAATFTPENLENLEGWVQDKYNLLPEEIEYLKYLCGNQENLQPILRGDSYVSPLTLYVDFLEALRKDERNNWDKIAKKEQEKRIELAEVAEFHAQEAAEMQAIDDMPIVPTQVEQGGNDEEYIDWLVEATGLQSSEVTQWENWQPENPNETLIDAKRKFYEDILFWGEEYTPEQLQKIKQLYALGREDDVFAYTQLIEQQQIAAQSAEDQRKLDDPNVSELEKIGIRAGNAVENIVMAPVAEIGYYLQTLGNAIRGNEDPLSRYSGAHSMMYGVNEAGNTLVYGLDPVSEFIVGGGASIAKNLLVAAATMGTPAGPIIMGLSTAGSSAYDANLKGATAGGSLLQGTLSGAGEIGIGQVMGSLSKFTGSINASGLKGKTSSLVASMIAEAGEEAVTEAFSQVVNKISMGESSNYNAYIQEYMAKEPDAPLGEAIAYASAQDAYQIIKAGATGLVTGGVKGGVDIAKNSVAEKSGIETDTTNNSSDKKTGTSADVDLPDKAETGAPAPDIEMTAENKVANSKSAGGESDLKSGKGTTTAQNENNSGTTKVGEVQTEADAKKTSVENANTVVEGSKEPYNKKIEVEADKPFGITEGQAYQDYLDAGLEFSEAEKLSGWENPPPAEHYKKWQDMYDDSGIIDQDTGALLTRASEGDIEENLLKEFEAERADTLGIYGGEGYARLEDATDADNEVLIEEYKKLSKNKEIEGQTHRLNQRAAFDGVIDEKEIVSVKMVGNIFTDIDSPHYKAYKSIEAFWSQYREGGAKEGSKPTLGEYNAALKQSLLEGGLSEAQASTAVKAASKQQIEYGLFESDYVPRIPGKINMPQNK